jgi:hypothetical protein
MDFRPNLEDNTYAIITLARSSPSVALPKTVQLAVYACTTPITLRTKAQIEDSKYTNSFIYIKSNFSFS